MTGPGIWSGRPTFFPTMPRWRPRRRTVLPLSARTFWRSLAWPMPAGFRAGGSARVPTLVDPSRSGPPSGAGRRRQHGPAHTLPSSPMIPMTRFPGRAGPRAGPDHAVQRSGLGQGTSARGEPQVAAAWGGGPFGLGDRQRRGGELQPEPHGAVSCRLEPGAPCVRTDRRSRRGPWPRRPSSAWPNLRTRECLPGPGRPGVCRRSGRSSQTGIRPDCSGLAPLLEIHVGRGDRYSHRRQFAARLAEVAEDIGAVGSAVHGQSLLAVMARFGGRIQVAAGHAGALGRLLRPEQHEPWFGWAAISRWPLPKAPTRPPRPSRRSPLQTRWRVWPRM